MAIKIQFRRDTAAEWTAHNPTLSAGEIGLESDQRKYKLGDGVKDWRTLGYMREGTVVENGTTLPTGGDISSWQLFYLTADDSTAKAAPGMYVHDGTGWICIFYTSAYTWGNTGATPAFTAIPGQKFTWTQNQEITSCTVTFTRPGIISATKSGAYAFAVPTMAGRTTKLVGTGAWIAAPLALCTIMVEDDGTYLWISSVGGV
jgi:hypothetical protein